MTHTITAMKARQNLGEVLNRVALRHDEYIIERGGRPMAAVIPIEKFQQLREAARRHLGQLLDKTWSTYKEIPAGEAAAVAEEARSWARKGRSSGR